MLLLSVTSSSEIHRIPFVVEKNYSHNLHSIKPFDS